MTRFGVTFAFLKKPASGLVVWLLLALIEAEDERDVPVLLERALAEDDHGARLDDRDAGDAAVRLEELGRAELSAEDARLEIHGALLFACAAGCGVSVSRPVGARRPQAKGTGDARRAEQDGRRARRRVTAPRGRARCEVERDRETVYEARDSSGAHVAVKGPRAARVDMP